MNTLPTDSLATGRMRPSGSLIRAAILAAVCLSSSPLCATTPFGFTAQAFRGPITEDVYAHHLNRDPLFNLLIHSSDQLGYDVVQITAQFAPMDAMGQPSQTGWHDHPTAITIGLVIQGTVWLQQAPNLNCARAIPTGSVFFERSGAIHNNYNFDPVTPAIVQVVHFVGRNVTAIRRDQPDQVTGDPMTATPPPPCPAESSAAHGAMPSLNLTPGGPAPASKRQILPLPAVVSRAGVGRRRRSRCNRNFRERFAPDRLA